MAAVFTDEELDLFDIDWNRWASANYTLRADEVDEIASLLEALSLALKRGILILGPSYAHEAELLRHVDWMPSDDEPIDASGAVLLSPFCPSSHLIILSHSLFSPKTRF